MAEPRRVQDQVANTAVDGAGGLKGALANLSFV